MKQLKYDEVYYQTKVREMQKEIEDSTYDLQVKEDKITQRNKQIKHLKDTIKELTAECKSWEGHAITMDKKLELRDKEILRGRESTKENIKDLEAENGDLKKAMAKLADQVTTLERENAEKCGKCTEFKGTSIYARDINPRINNDSFFGKGYEKLLEEADEDKGEEVVVGTFVKTPYIER